MPSPLLLIAAASVAVVPNLQPDLSHMNLKDVRAYNASLDRSDPRYIRCVISDDTGSLVKKTMVCRTNLQWKRADSRESDAAREVAEDILQHDRPTGGS